MIVFAYGYLLLFLSSVGAIRLLQAQNESARCSACADNSCQVMDDIRVKKLCADELCVKGQSVVVGDGDPCTSDDVVNGVVTHVPLRDCCRTKADCEQWMPDVCHKSVCVPLPTANATHGACFHQKIAGCCACDADCPARPCQTVRCEATDQFSTTFTKFSPNDAHFTMLSKRNDVINAPGTCVYEDVPDTQECCERSADCVNGEQGTIGVCDKSGTCIYVVSTKLQCQNNTQCAADAAGCADCRARGRCFDNVCDRGFCACKPDFDKDSDGDGVCCRDDCDDTNRNVTTPIFCTVLNATQINKDNDTFVRCGAQVVEVCNTTCPAGRVRVNETQLDTAFIHHEKERFVRFDCDCCDMLPNNSTPDESLTCGKDHDRDNVFEPVPDSQLPPGLDPALINLTPPGCFANVCVLQAFNRTRPNHTRNHDDDDESSDSSSDSRKHEDDDDGDRSERPKRNQQQHRRHRGGNDRGFISQFETTVSDAVRDQQCAAAFGNNPDFVFVPDSLQDSTARCDQCPNNDEATLADVSCPATVSFNNKTFAACTIESPGAGTTLEACCAEILQIDSGAANVPAEFNRWRACCSALEDQNFPDDKECAGATDASFPLVEDQCTCQELPVLCEKVITCVPDKDFDGYFDCAHPQTVCVSQIPKKFKGSSGGHDLEDKLCREHFAGQGNWGSLETALNGQDNDKSKFGQGTFCDCLDSNPDAFQFIACFEDKDNDGVPACTFESNTPDNCVLKKPRCTAICRAKCDGNSLPQNHHIGNSTHKNCHKEGVQKDDDKRKRSVSELKQALAKRGLRFGGDKTDHENSDRTDRSDRSSESSSSESSAHSIGSASTAFVDDDDDDEDDKSRSSTRRVEDTESSRSDTHTRPHRVPRHDQKCDKFECDICDCCDTDKFVYEQNPFLPVWSSADETKCGGFDYNCNCRQDDVVACPGAKQKDTSDNRILFTVFNGDPTLGQPNKDIFVAGSNQSNNQTIGSCRDPDPSANDNNDCLLTPGWSLEGEGTGPERKRAPISIQLMAACKTLVKTIWTGTQVRVFNAQDKSKALRAFRPGDCAEWVENCTEPTPPLSNTCSPDCEICTRVEF